MHPSNKHNGKYNLDVILAVVPTLEKFVMDKFDRKTIDFSKPKAVKLLNKALLKLYYDVDYWDFPDKNLCPPIPGRVDYIYYINDLIANENAPIKILDIGTGATLIYPLLGNSLFSWQFVATDCNRESLENAKKIIAKNKLSDVISLRFQKDATKILKGILKATEVFTVVMCNPPFYASEEEANNATNRKLKGLRLDTKDRNFSGTSNELWYKGGEKAFLHNYLYESSLYKNNSKWFTTLVSKKENVKSMKVSLQKLGAKIIKVIPMQQGNKISRIVAWSFSE